MSIYTAPAGKVVLFKRIALRDGLGVNLPNLFVGIQTGGVSYSVLETPAAGVPTRNDEIEHVMEAGDEITLYVASLSPGEFVEYYVSGSVLTSP